MVKPAPPVKGRIPAPSAAQTTGIVQDLAENPAQIFAFAPRRNRGNTPLPPDSGPRRAFTRKVRLHG